MRMVLRMNLQIFVLAAEIPCEWTFATKFASDCECDGVVHSGDDILESFFESVLSHCESLWGRTSSVTSRSL